MDASKIIPDSIVFANDSNQRGSEQLEPLGTVDHMDGDNYIKLKRSDSPDGQHRWVPLKWVSKVDDKGVQLNCTRQEFNENVLRSPPAENRFNPRSRVA